VRVEYFEKRKPIGYLEIYRTKSKKPMPVQSSDPSAQAEKDGVEYVAKTEHTRWYFTTLKSSAEQVEQDLNSVLK
jgi:hypothetical protein